jgi:hypothetical protein
MAEKTIVLRRFLMITRSATGSCAPAITSDPAPHWHGYVAAHRADLDSRTTRRPDAVLTTPNQVADWLEQEIRALVSAPPESDWSDSRAAWTELATDGESLASGAGDTYIIADVITAPGCDCQARAA